VANSAVTYDIREKFYLQKELSTCGTQPTVTVEAPSFNFYGVMHMHDSVIMYLLKIGFSRPTPQTLTNPDKMLQAYVGRTQISCVKILASWAKEAQNDGKR